PAPRPTGSLSPPGRPPAAPRPASTPPAGRRALAAHDRAVGVASYASTMSARRQLSFDDLGTPLAEATLAVVDLETTGTDPAADAITEIGAVKVRGGEVLGEFRTFVDPERPIPAFVAALTGITDAAVAQAPSIRTVLPMFLDFVGDAALVAHNARFDVGF